MTTEEAIATAVTMLSETFRQPLTKIAASAYTLALEGLTAAEVSVALKRALREAKFMPSPSELLGFAGKGGPLEMARRSAEAWEAVRTAMDRHDYTTNVHFGPHVNAIVRNLGGWCALCDKSIPELVWVRKEFEKLYEAFDGQEMGERGAPLYGEFGSRGTWVAIPIGGVKPRLEIEAARSAASDLVRGLAEAKSVPR